MSTEQNNYSEILSSLERRFESQIAVNRLKFQKLIGISQRTDCRRYMAGDYPATIQCGGEERILLTDLAKYLADRPDGRNLPRRTGKKGMRSFVASTGA